MTDTTQYPFIQLILGYADARTAIYKWDKEHVDALAAELHSLLTSNAMNAQLAAEWEAKHHALRTQIAEMGREMASVVAERDALKAQQPKAPVRKLREVKGVTYLDGFWVDADGCKWEGASGVIWINNVRNPRQKQGELTDADFLAIYALKDDPYEPVETVEEVLREMYGLFGVSMIAMPKYHEDVITRLRAAFAAEQGGAE